MPVDRISQDIFKISPIPQTFILNSLSQKRKHRQKGTLIKNCVNKSRKFLIHPNILSQALVKWNIGRLYISKNCLPYTVQIMNILSSTTSKFGLYFPGCTSYNDRANTWVFLLVTPIIICICGQCRNQLWCFSLCKACLFSKYWH